MITIQNYKTGEGCTFRGWDLCKVEEGEIHYSFNFADTSTKYFDRYSILLEREGEGDYRGLSLFRSGGACLFDGAIHIKDIRIHWEFLDKCILLLETYKRIK